MKVTELLNRKLIDYGETPRAASLACGLSNNAITRILREEHVELHQKTRRLLCLYFDIDADVLDAAIDEGRRKKIW